jgi:hypothetical protein
MGNEYDDDLAASNGSGHQPYNQVRDEESSRKLDYPVIVEDESQSSNPVRQRTSSKKRREPDMQGQT